MSAVLSIPRYPGDVTPQWLSAALSGDGTPVEVADVEVVAIGTGQTGATYRVTARYATDPGDLPQTFVIKLPAQDDTVRDRVVIGYRSECAFYSSVADRVQVPTPRCYYSEITDDAMDFALLLADQAPAVQGDQLIGCGEAEARLAVTALAGLHAPSWCDPVWLDFPGIAFGRPDEAGANGMGEVAKMSADITLEKLGDRMSAQDRETFSAAMGLIAPWLLSEQDRFALLHGDYRLDNLLFDPNDQGQRGRLADARRGPAGPGPRLLHRNQPQFATAGRHRRRPRRRLSPGVDGGGVPAMTAKHVGAITDSGCRRPLISALGFAFAAATERGDDMVLTMLAGVARRSAIWGRWT